jgi:hypothetical protein
MEEGRGGDEAMDGGREDAKKGGRRSWSVVLL